MSIKTELKIIVNFFVLLIMLTEYLKADNVLDSVLIEEVKIVKTNINQVAGFKSYVIDSLVMKESLSSDLSEVLANHSPVYIKAYVNGGLSTSSFRGSGANHTQVTWNGIIVNNPMLGQVDFSLFPIFFSDKIELNMGAASIENNTGAIGGNINLVNLPDWKNKLAVTFTEDIGNIGSTHSNFSFQKGNSKFQSKSKLIYYCSENDYSYYNTESLNNTKIEKRKFADYGGSGFLQEFYGRFNDNNFLSVKILGQLSRRSIPPPLTIKREINNETQENNNLWSVLKYVNYKGQRKISYSFSYLIDQYNYNNILSSVNTSNRCQSFLNKADISFTNNFIFNAGLSNSVYLINTESYLENKNRAVTAVYVSVKKEFNQRLAIYSLIREELLNSGIFSPLLPSFGVDFRIIKNKGFFIKYNISKNIHYPTFNDLYWLPGGNPYLENEEGLLNEICLSGYELDLFSLFTAEANISGYYSNISKRIIWLPNNYGLWEACNYDMLVSKGFEGNLKISKLKGKLNWTFIMDYSFCISEDREEKLQLIYVPKNQLGIISRVSYKDYYLNYNFSYIDKRYITSDHTWHLPPYWVSGLSVGKTFNFLKYSLSLQAKADNLFNKDYQSVAYQPAPKRNYHIIINFKFNK